MGKITVKHYLNKKLKASIRNGVLEYSVYVRVSYGRKNERIKSEWIIHPCSDYDFANNPIINELIEYEKNIILDIFSICKSEDNINLSARLGHSTDSVTEHYIGWVIESKLIKNTVIEFISRKTELNKTVLRPYLNLDYLSSEDWVNIAKKVDFESMDRDKIIFYSMLLEFEKRFYPSTDSDFGFNAGDTLNYYEWRNKKAREKFISFANDKNILSVDIISSITQIFDSKLFEFYTWDINIERKR